jgi:hypothetical protein
MFLMSVLDLRTSVFNAFWMWKVRLLSSKADFSNCIFYAFFAMVVDEFLKREFNKLDLI